MKKVLIALALVFTANGANAALATYYDSSSRTVYLLDDSSFTNPRVYFATKNYFTDKCGGVQGGMMNYKLPSSLSTGIKTTLEAKANGIGGSIMGNRKYKQQFPKVYYYNYTSMVQTQLRYNVVTDRSKTGWLPDTNNGCTYTPPK